MSVAPKSGFRRRGRYAVAGTIVALVLAIATAALAHWATTISVGAAVENGSLGLTATDDPDFNPGCTTSPDPKTGTPDTRQLTFQNTGSIPIGASLTWYAADSTYCELFDVTMAVGATTLYSGGLCGLLASPVQVTSQLDPEVPSVTAGESVTVDITVTPDPAEATWACPASMSLTATSSWAQWIGTGWSTVGSAEPFTIAMTAATHVTLTSGPIRFTRPVGGGTGTFTIKNVGGAALTVNQIFDSTDGGTTWLGWNKCKNIVLNPGDSCDATHGSAKGPDIKVNYTEGATTTDVFFDFAP